MNTTTYSSTAIPAPLSWRRVAVLTLKIGLVVLATAAGAWIKIPLPFTPVPITLQSLAVLVGAAWLGRWWGGIAQGTYLTLGSLGLPVFAGGLGSLLIPGPYLLGPTGGYLIGFVAAAIFVGEACSRRAHFRLWQLALVFAAAKLVILTTGVTHLYFWLNMGATVSFKHTLLLGVVPFLPGAVLKVAAATLIVHRLRRDRAPQG